MPRVDSTRCCFARHLATVFLLTGGRRAYETTPTCSGELYDFKYYCVVRRGMTKNKIPATYTLDADVHSWINNKLGKKSTFVNRILLTAMLDERITSAKKQDMPRCPDCNMRLGKNQLGEGLLCGNLHCGWYPGGL